MCKRNASIEGTGIQHEQQQCCEDRIAVWALDHVICGGGNCTAQGPCYYEDICPTCKAAGPHAVAVITYEANNCS